MAFHRLRLDVASALRCTVHGLDRRDRGSAGRSEHHLRGHGRGDHPAGSRNGERHVQVHRRGEDVDSPRAARDADDRRGGCGSAQSEPALRRGARTSVRPERGARHLPLHRWRQIVREGVVQGRVHERQRRRHRSTQSGCRLRRALAAAGVVSRGERVQRWRRRDLQVHRWRYHVEAIEERPAGRAPGKPFDIAEQSEHPLRRGCGVHAAGAAAHRRRDRFLQEHRRRRALERGQRRSRHFARA